MQEDFMEQTVSAEEPLRGTPVDITKDELIAFHLSQAKAFGTLKMQKPLMVMYGVYLAVIAVSFFVLLADGEFSLLMLGLFVLTVILAVLTLTVMPARLKKAASDLYDAGNMDGYYGELTVTAQEIVKDLGYDRVALPLNERSTYMEDSGFMAFTSAGENRAIVLPARCVTPALASQIRKAVFSPSCAVRRHVIRRMEPLAAAPMAVRPLPTEPPTLFEVRTQYTPEELKKIAVDLGWSKLIKQLPMTVLLSFMVAAMIVVPDGDLLTFGMGFVGMLLAMLAVHILRVYSGSKRMTADPRTHTLTMRMTAWGLAIRCFFSAQFPEIRIKWESVERAVERPDCVEFYCRGFQMVRLPKRCVDNMDELKAIVDTYRKHKEL